MTKNKLIQLVNARLAKVGHGIAFDIIVEGVRQEDSWWYVPVVATRNRKEIPRELAVNIFANAEDDLEQDHKVTVLFVPVAEEKSSANTKSRTRVAR